MGQGEQESVASMFERAIDLATGIDADAAFDLLNQIIDRRDRAFDLAVWRMRTGEVLERAMSVYILGLLCLERREGEPDFLLRILERTRTERDEEVHRAMVIAFRQAADPRAIPWLVNQARNGDATYRRGVIQALGVCIANNHGGREGLDTVIAATTDFNDDVRDWATHELALIIRNDSVRIRETLFARLSDENEDVRHSALAGLAKRRDQRALPVLLENLASGDVWRLDVQAAASLRSGKLLKPLQALKSWWNVDEDLLDFAIDSCDIRVEARNYAKYEQFRKALQYELSAMFPGIQISLACDVEVEGGPVVAVSNAPDAEVSWPTVAFLLARDDDDPEAAAATFAEEVIRRVRRR